MFLVSNLAACFPKHFVISNFVYNKITGNIDKLLDEVPKVLRLVGRSKDLSPVAPRAFIESLFKETELVAELPLQERLVQV